MRCEETPSAGERLGRGAIANSFFPYADISSPRGAVFGLFARFPRSIAGHRSCTGSTLRAAGGGCGGFSPSGPSIRRSHADQGARLHCRRRAHAGARHRRQHCRLRHGQLGAAASAPLRPPGAAREDLGTVFESGHSAERDFRARGVGSARHAAFGIRHRGLQHGYRREPDARRQRAAARHDQPGLCGAAADARREARARPPLQRRRRQAGARPRRATRFRLLENADGRRRRHRGSRHSTERPEIHRRRRPARRIHLRRRRQHVAAARTRSREAEQSRQPLPRSARAAEAGRDAAAGVNGPRHGRAESIRAVGAVLPEGQRIRLVPAAAADGSGRRREAWPRRGLHRGRFRAADRVPQPREPAAGARIVARPRTGRPRRARRRPAAAGAADGDGKRRHLGRRRRLRRALSPSG